MNNVEIWRQLTDRHPAMKDPENVVKLKSRGLKALIDQAFECGRASVPTQPDLNYEAFASLFTNRIFGKKH